VQAIYLGATALVPGRQVTLRPYDAEGAAPGRPDRPVFAQGKWHQAHVVMRHQLAPGDTLTGPALVEEPDSTTYVPPDFGLDVDGSGCLVLTEQRHQVAP
jgi:N-methylhydantoinase A